MNQKKLSVFIRATAAICALFAVFIYFAAFPFAINKFVSLHPDYSYILVPWLVLVWITSVPAFIILAQLFCIGGEIGKDNSFSRKNASALHIASLLFISDAVIFFVGNAIFLFLNMSNAAIFIASVFICAAICVFAVLSGCLSHLVLKAAKLDEESRYTV